jgi:hypothetical protein
VGHCVSPAKSITIPSDTTIATLNRTTRYEKINYVSGRTPDESNLNRFFIRQIFPGQRGRLRARSEIALVAGAKLTILHVEASRCRMAGLSGRSDTLERWKLIPKGSPKSAVGQLGIKAAKFSG